MKRKKTSVKKKGLKGNHKILLYAAVSVVALSLTFWGLTNSQINSQSGVLATTTTNTTKPPCKTSTGAPCPLSPIPSVSNPKYLSCSMCSSKKLCFSASKQFAYCGGLLTPSQTPTDSSCVSCPEVSKTPTPTPTGHPIPSCYTRVPVSTSTNNTTYKYVPCTSTAK